ncbi:MAG: thermonuclease family protein, partial [Candidatus Woesebacteria bacterium]|nr:thermonuclease family protein [Candidatus Woesebacteria bacterium]
MSKIFKNFKKLLIPGLIILSFIIGFLGRGLIFNQDKTSATPTSSTKPGNIVLPNPKEGVYKVTRVLDGDTIEIETGEKVRYMGINAPENNERWGMTAKEFNEKMVSGKEVQIELDRLKIDNYGRVLAYVWVDKKMVNEELLKEGLAKVLIIKGEAKLKYIDR